jgi:hypothetical protein
MVITSLIDNDRSRRRLITPLVSRCCSKTGKNDCKTVDQIKEHLRKYAIDMGKIGKDNSWGWGRVDVSKLIEASENGNTKEPVQPVTPEPVKEFLGKNPDYGVGRDSKNHSRYSCQCPRNHYHQKNFKRMSFYTA